MVTDERRTSPRHTAYLAGELETSEGQASIAITRDVSAAGLLLYTRIRDLGETVKLTVMHGGEKLQITGKVVRVEPRRRQRAVAYEGRDLRRSG